MRTRSSSNLPVESPPNPSTSNPKRRNRRRSKQPFILEESPVDTMTDQRTMVELLRAPTMSYAEPIVVPLILVEQFELKHSLINMMTSDQFFGLEKENSHDHIRWFNKINSTIKYKDVPNSAVKLMLFPFSLARAARWWLEKEPPHSILTWEDLVSKFINKFFSPSRTTNLRNEISNFQLRIDESFHEAWDRYKDLLRTCPHHGFTKLHQLDTFYNALNPANQDSLNSAAGGNLLERRTQDVLRLSKTNLSQSANKCGDYRHDSYSQTISSNPTSSSVKAIGGIYVTCGGAHLYYQYLAAGGNTSQNFAIIFMDTLQQPQLTTIRPQRYNRGKNFNQDQPYQAPTQQNQVVPLSELEKIKRVNEVNMKAMQTQINNVKNELRNEMKNSIQASMSNQTNKLKNMMASFFQMNTASTLGSGHLPSNTIANPKGELKAITTRSGIVLDGPSVPIPHLFINPEEDERVEETLTDQDLAEYTGNGHSRNRQKPSQKRQNQTQNGKDRKRQSHLKPKVKSQSPRSTKVNLGKVKVNPGNNRPAFYDDDDDDVDYTIAIIPVLSTKEPDNTLSMGDEHLNTILATEQEEIIKSGVEELVPILNENEVTLEDKKECDVPVYENSLICDDHFEIFSDSNNDDDILSGDDSFEDIEYVEASLFDLEIVSIAEENVVYQEEEEVNFEDISQIQDVILCEKLLSMNRLIANIESLNEYHTLDLEKLINVVKNDIPDDSTNDPLLEEADLFLAFNNSIPPGIKNFGDDSEGDIRFLEALLSDDSIPFLNNESSKSDFDNPSVPQPLPEQLDADFEPDSGDEISVVMKNNDKIERLNPRDEFYDDDYLYFMFVIYSKMFLSFLSAKSEDAIFDPGIANYRFYSFKPGLSHRCGTFKKFNTHRSHLNESPMEILFSTCFPSDQLIRGIGSSIATLNKRLWEAPHAYP
nr:hypothetical protein [Tanacetum cinerariifolium]